MYTSLSLSPLSISLAELSVSDSSPSLPATSAKNSCGRDACGGGDGGGDGGWLGVSSLHTAFCLNSACHFAGFICSSGNCFPLNHKGTSSPSVLLSTLKYKGQFAWASIPCSACIGSTKGFLFVSVVLHFQNQAELTDLSSFWIYRNFILGSQRILQCFFLLRYNRFIKVVLQKRIINSFLIYIVFFLSIYFCWYTWFFRELIIF